MPLVAQAERNDIRTLLSYPPHSSGASMTTEYACLPADITAGEAIARLRVQAPDKETIYSVWVLDGERHLLGTVSLRQLVMAKPDAVVGAIMQREVISVRVDEDPERVARLWPHYDLLAIPVVDPDNHLVGIVTHDDVMDVVLAEATEDLQRQGAVVASLLENYLEANFVAASEYEAGWLVVLPVRRRTTDLYRMLAHFEDEIAKVVALSLFVPLCISTGGNSGSQAATLVTRAMALGANPALRLRPRGALTSWRWASPLGADPRRPSASFAPR